MRASLLPRLAVAAALLATAAVPALAEIQDILLDDGRVVRGEILEIREDGLRVKGAVKSGGNAEIVIRADLLDAEWYYGIRDKAAGEDAKAHLKLAMWSLDRGLFSRAQIQVRRAAAIDPKLVKDILEGKLPDIRDGIAAKILESARRDAKEGRPANAVRKVEILLARLPDTPAGAEAVEVLAEFEGQVADREKKDQEEARAKLAEADRKAQEECDRLLTPVEETLTKGRKRASDALGEDNQPKAVEMLGEALKMGDAALDRLDALSKQKTDDTMFQGRVAELKTRITAAMVRGRLHRAEMFVWRGSHAQARTEIQKVRELDPGNLDAEALETRIDDSEEDTKDDRNWTRGARGDSRFGGRRGGGGGRR
jgi:hypothetical protein